MIYRDWNDYWTKGNHGYTSACKEDAKEIWQDFQETLNATRGDYEQLLIKQSLYQEKEFLKRIKVMLKYLTTYDLEKHATKKFFKWWLDEEIDYE